MGRCNEFADEVRLNEAHIKAGRLPFEGSPHRDVVPRFGRADTKASGFYFLTIFLRRFSLKF